MCCGVIWRLCKQTEHEVPVALTDHAAGICILLGEEATAFVLCSDVDDDSEPDVKPRPSKRARGAAAANLEPPNSHPQQPLELPIHEEQQQQQPAAHHHHHPEGLHHEAPRVIARGTPCQAAIRAYEDALKKVCFCERAWCLLHFKLAVSWMYAVPFENRSCV